MKKSQKRYVIAMFILCMLCLCMPAVKTQAKVTLSQTKLVMKAGKRTKIKVNGTTLPVTWTSRDKKIAKVCSHGSVSAVKAGNTTIVAKVGTQVVKCKVVVVSMNKTHLTLKKSSKKKIKVLNGSAGSWKSSNTAVAKVSSTGNVTAVGYGTAKITCQSRGVTLACKVYVPKKKKSYITFSTDTEMNKTKSLALSYYYEKPTYTSSNPSVCTVNSSGVCKPVSAGIATITAKTDGCKYTMNVSVGVFTPSSWLPSSSKVAQLNQKIYIGGGKTRTYKIYGQSYSTNTFKNNIKLANYATATTTAVESEESSPEESSSEESAETSTTTEATTETKTTTATTNTKTTTTATPVSYTTYYMKNFIQSHGCTTCAATTILNAFSSYSGSPKLVVKNVEPKVLGLSVWKANYKKSKKKQRSMSFYGVSKVLTKYNIKNTYVRYFSSQQQAMNQVAAHLLKGKPVIIIVGCKNHLTGKSDYRWTGTGRHTMLLLGMTTDNKVIVGDSGNRSGTWGKHGRIKTVPLTDIGAYLFTCTKKTGSNLTNPYYTKYKYCGGYILVG